MDPLKDIIKRVVSQLEEKGKEEQDLFKTWEKIAGKKAAAHSKPAFFKAKKMVINVSNSSWLYKLTLEKAKLIEEFNKNIKSRKKVKELRFRIGEITEKE